MAAPWISSPEMAMRDPGQGGRHRQTWRWSTPARIVGCGDASSRSVATAGDLVPSSAMAMLQLDVRGLVVSASSDAAMLERGEKKPPRGVRGGKSACGSGRKKPRRRSGRKTARPDVQLGHFRRGVKAMHSHYTGTQVDVKVLRPEQQGLRAVGHFNFFHAKTGPRGWALSLPWLGLAPA